MEPSAGRRDESMTNGESVAVDAPNNDKSAIPEMETYLPKVNGEVKTPKAMPSENEMLGEDSNEAQELQETAPTVPSTGQPRDTYRIDSMDTEKSDAALKDDVSTPSLLEVKKDQNTVIGRATSDSTEKGLGSLLKGSAFEPEKEEKPIGQTPEAPPLTGMASSPSKETKSAGCSVPVGQPKSRPQSSTVPTKLSSQASSRPSANSNTYPVPSSTKTPSMSSAKKTTTSQKSPTSLRGSKSSPRDIVSKAVSSKRSLQSKEGDEQAGNDTKLLAKGTAAEPSVASRATTQASYSTNPATSTTTKKSIPLSPKLKKPRPKSPTRPARLPAAATAPTAASAAKFGGGLQPRPSSQTSVRGVIKHSANEPPQKAPIKSPKVTQERPLRSSLPTASNAGSRPKPRVSLAGSNPTGEDFLARMMRPTQSSASKTHDRAEQKTPPKKRLSSRPKRVSDVSTKPSNKKPSDESTPQLTPEAQESKNMDPEESLPGAGLTESNEFVDEPTLTNPAAEPQKAVEEAFEANAIAAEQPPEVLSEEKCI